MAWTTPTTVAAGDAILASLWNNQVKGNLDELAPFSAAWTSWTPTVTGLGFTITQGNATSSGKYLKVGRFVAFYAQWKFGSTTSFGAGAGSFSLSLPTNALLGSAVGSSCTASILDSGTAYYGAAVRPADSTVSGINVSALSAAGTYLLEATVSATTPMTWAVNDQIFWAGTYEASA